MSLPAGLDPALIDGNITRVINTLRANRGMSVNELILRSGVAKSTFMRRKAHGGWTAVELAQISAALDVQPAVLHRDPSDLIDTKSRFFRPAVAA